MPIYEYECKVCSKRTELLQKISDAPLSACPECQGAVRKVVSPPGLHFKGTGWYVTDYAKKNGKDAGSSKSADKPKNTSPTPTTKGTSKPSGGTKES